MNTTIWIGLVGLAFVMQFIFTNRWKNKQEKAKDHLMQLLLKQQYEDFDQQLENVRLNTYEKAMLLMHKGVFKNDEKLVKEQVEIIKTQHLTSQQAQAFWVPVFIYYVENHNENEANQAQNFLLKVCEDASFMTCLTDFKTFVFDKKSINMQDLQEKYHSSTGMLKSLYGKMINSN